jgi:integrase/recombinase XerD
MYSGFSFPKGTQSRTRRTAVEFFSESADFSTRLCAFGVNRSTLSSPARGASQSKNRISIPISKAIDGFMKFKVAEGLSKRTIDSYEFYLNQWMEHVGDQDVAKVTASDLTNYIAWMRTEYKPRRWNGNKDPLSAKSLRNVYIALRSFYTWLHKEFKIPSPFVDITPPKFPKHIIQTFSKEDIENLIKACVYSREAQTDDRKAFVMRRPSANRDQAIVLLLLDTGLRATGLCSLTVEDVDLKTGKVNIRHGVSEGGAKGGRGHTVFIGKSTRRAACRYSTDGNG